MLPTLRTARLTLSPFTPDDAALVQRYAGDARIAATTAFVPHPYPDGVAEAWIATHLPQFLEKSNVTLAIRARESGALRGAINLKLTPSPATAPAPAAAPVPAHAPAPAVAIGAGESGCNPHSAISVPHLPAPTAAASAAIGEIGYWVAVPFWNQGICTEAVRRIVRYGFDELPRALDRTLAEIRAHHFVENPASGRVMEKAGMRRAGVIPRALSKNGRLIDLVRYTMPRPHDPENPGPAGLNPT
ncbi:MAG: GNAT family N-acetyltransferase [Opitutaceae bacterium]|jgi:RimJ/RimL family protein N-acetyltransferase|nr:GNAT family N-acetyltransferase [Opitutaceae bacterium]